MADHVLPLEPVVTAKLLNGSGVNVHTYVKEPEPPETLMYPPVDACPLCPPPGHGIELQNTSPYPSMMLVGASLIGGNGDCVGVIDGVTEMVGVTVGVGCGVGLAGTGDGVGVLVGVTGGDTAGVAVTEGVGVTDGSGVELGVGDGVGVGSTGGMYTPLFTFAPMPIIK